MLELLWYWIEIKDISLLCQYISHIPRKLAVAQGSFFS